MQVYDIIKKIFLSEQLLRLMQITTYRIDSKLNRSCRIALAADTHDKPVDRLFRELEALKPDLILIPGDIVFRRKKGMKTFTYDPDIPMLLRFPNGDRLVHEAPLIAPTFFSYGNHEWMLNIADEERMADAGVKLLDNAWTKFGEFVIGGLSSPDVTNYRTFQNEWRRAHPDDPRGNLREEFFKTVDEAIRVSVDAEWLNGFEAQDGYKILLCHHPEYWAIREPRLAGHPIDLVVAGHAHGGQIPEHARGNRQGLRGRARHHHRAAYERRRNHLHGSRILAVHVHRARQRLDPFFRVPQAQPPEPEGPGCPRRAQRT